MDSGRLNTISRTADSRMTPDTLKRERVEKKCFVQTFLIFFLIFNCFPTKDKKFNTLTSWNN